MMIIGCERVSGVPNKVSRVALVISCDFVRIKIGMGRPEASKWSGLVTAVGPKNHYIARIVSYYNCDIITF
ncbi:hypothetical protein EAG_06270 [Camponotus floridanus]|uniref:Uncharacterized protein n=1 Tax=Camponotus floridanus TaxID=104421 RepID=E2A654_CAMFO|nr:hypothetical protein EAG_06270 [Camponotus floridanus]